VGWVILLVSLVVGLGVGFLFWKKKLIGAFFLASWGGFSFGLLIYNSFLYKINSDIALWSFTVGMGVLYGVLILFWAEHILIHATSMIGSFLTIASIGLVAGGYQNPFTIVDLIKYDQITEIDPRFYAYLGANVVLYVMGCVVQYRHLRQKKELEREFKADNSTKSLNESQSLKRGLKKEI
jgi:zinc transporter ZupT